MILNVRSRLREWYDTLETTSDPRMNRWFLMQSPVPIMGLVGLYLAIVVYGPKLMRDRKPFQLKTILYFYNAFQVALSAYMFTEVVLTSWEGGHNFKCQRVDYSESPLAMRVAKVSWWYFFSKIVDMMDTVFFILRKKNSQVSVLHVYHHSTMLFFTWLCVKYAPGGQAVVTALLNSFVHTVMYTYYFLSTLGPRVQPYLWWKKYLTQLQLVQFALVLTHMWYGVYSQCEFPTFLGFLFILYPITMLVLFSNFYVHSYIRKRKQQ